MPQELLKLKLLKIYRQGIPKTLSQNENLWLKIPLFYSKKKHTLKYRMLNMCYELLPHTDTYILCMYVYGNLFIFKVSSFNLNNSHTFIDIITVKYLTKCFL